MLVVHVRRDGQEFRSHHFEQSEVTVGRVHGQDIELPAKDVSRRHARIAWRGDRVLVTHEKVQRHQHVLEYEGSCT